MTDDRSWLEVGAFSTPRQAAERLGITPDTVRSWAQAGYIRYLAEGNPKRFLLRDDDIDELADLLRGVTRPTLASVRLLRRNANPHEYTTGNDMNNSRTPTR